MERLQGPINPCFFGEHLEVECLEQGLSSSAGTLRFEEEEEEEARLSIPGLDDRMPFLQMLQSVESPAPFFPSKEQSFQALLRLQHLKKPWELGNSFVETQIQALELESCVTHDIDIVEELHSPIKSEANKDVNQHHHHHHPHSTEGVSSECNQEQQPSSVENNTASTVSVSTWAQAQVQAQAQAHPQTAPNKQTHSSKSLPVTRERRKRKRARPAKNKEEVESQRMTHIAVERNRRRQMNDHLNVLRSLMPTSYIQRGDQASIVGGAIDFVKELEQLLQSLEAQKKMRKSEGGGGGSNNGSDTPVSSSSSSATAMAVPFNGMFMSLSQYKIGSEESNNGDEVTAENKSEEADIQVTVIQTHVNLKIQCPRKPGQLLKAIVALEDLRLTILHLNITTSHSTVLYSFNLKIEDGCKLGSADDIAGAVHQIFRYMESS